jgi:predicted small secreted protein
MIHLFKRTIVLLIVTALVVVASVGCHTANGFGKGIQDAGKGIENGTK